MSIKLFGKKKDIYLNIYYIYQNISKDVYRKIPESHISGFKTVLGNIPLTSAI
jgi:hypothetical protein